MSIRRSIARTARHHRDLDRRDRPQHGTQLSRAARFKLIKEMSGKWIFLDAFAGYHKCGCSACCRWRGYVNRSNIKAIIAQMGW